jgi:ribosomal protein S18 acetylase RimI-like enzyme
VSTPHFTIEPLGKQDRDGFDSGSAELDGYLARQAGQDQRRNVGACFLAIEMDTRIVAGFYTLSACHIHLKDLDEAARKKLPRYPVVPAVRLGRLAIDRHFQGRGLGSALIANAAMRAMRSEIAAAFLVVEAKDETAAAFYRHHGFAPDPIEALRLYASLAALKASFAMA